MPTSFLIQLLFQCLLDQLFQIRMRIGGLGPQETGKRKNKYEKGDDGDAEGIIQGGSTGKGWTKKGISMHREDTWISLLNQGYLA